MTKIIKMSFKTDRKKDLASMIQEIAEFLGNTKLDREDVSINLEIGIHSKYGWGRSQRTRI